VDHLKELARRVRDAASALPVLRQDALLYLTAAVFAAGESWMAITADYREWGRVAVGPYLAGAVACEVAYRIARSRRGGGRYGAHSVASPDATATPAASTGLVREPEARLRHIVVVAVLALAVLLPLALQVNWRAQAPLGATNPHSAQAQPEVAVIERAGDRVFHFQGPYLAHPTTVGLSPSNDDRRVNANSFFPYLPGMIPFGLANAGDVPRQLTDARVELGGFTLLVTILALSLAPVPSRRRWRAFQFLVVLPTGALPMVTGGDDLPVLALLLLGLVLISRRHPVLGGVAMGLAGTLKWTAWPLILLAALCVRDEDGRPAVGRYGLSMLLVVVPIVGSVVALAPHAFAENVIAFPLGLTKVHSPAASPLPGQILVNLFPAEKRGITAALVLAGIAIVLVQLVRRRPREVGAAARFSGWALAFATFIAPATRFGYFIYPVNMLVWAYLLDRGTLRLPVLGSARPAGAHLRTAQLASAT
jgi:hypothetical protein